jgi:hypothetical protein
VPAEYAAPTEYTLAAEHAGLTDRPSLAYSPAATPVLPRPAYPAQDPQEAYGQVPTRPAPAAQQPVPAPAFDDVERVRPAQSRQVVFEEPEFSPFAEQLELGEPTGQHPGQAAGQVAARPTESAEATGATHAAAPVPAPEPVAVAESVKAATAEVASVPAAEPATPVSESEPAADGTPEQSGEDQARQRQGKKNARGRRSSVPSWDEIMLGSSRQRD